MEVCLLGSVQRLHCLRVGIIVYLSFFGTMVKISGGLEALSQADIFRVPLLLPRPLD
jgi:hypothetical protein